MSSSITGLEIFIICSKLLWVPHFIYLDNFWVLSDNLIPWQIHASADWKSCVCCFWLTQQALIDGPVICGSQLFLWNTHQSWILLVLVNNSRLTGLNTCRNFMFSSHVCNYALPLCLISGRYSPPLGRKTVYIDFLLQFHMPKYTLLLLVTRHFLLDTF